MILTGHDITEIAGMRISTNIFNTLNRSELSGTQVKVTYLRTIRGKQFKTIQFMNSYVLNDAIKWYTDLIGRASNRHREVHERNLLILLEIKKNKETKMQYEYECSICEIKVTVEKPLADHAREEKCDGCGAVMQKLYGSTALRTGDGFKSKNG